jgi:hypothetical protein
MFFTLDGAVKATGLSKSALIRALECGHINGTKDLFDEWWIEHSELCQISRPLAEPADKNGTSTSTVCNAATLETDIAALVKDAGGSLRGPVSGFHRDMKQTVLQRSAAEPSETDECSASLPNNIDLRLKEACVDPATRDPHIKISDVERISAPDAKGSRRALATDAILGMLGIGCILLGSVAYFFGHGVSTPVENGVKSSPQSAELPKPAATGTPKTDRQATAALPRPDQIAALAARIAAQRPDSTGPDRQPRPTKASPVVQQNAAAPTARSDVARHPKSSSRSMPFPETRPTTIEGWMVRDVVGGTAMLQGPDGVRRVTLGDTLPGAGRVVSIVRWGNRWIVATSRGLISTP